MKKMNESWIKTGLSRANRTVLAGGIVAALIAGLSVTASAQFYLRTNLVSDVPGEALLTNSNLVGAWGITHSPTSPWWINTTVAGTSLVIDGTGQPRPLVVTVPPTNGATPTGIVFNGGTNFEVEPGKPAAFIFATLNGVISGWNPTQSNTAQAVVQVDNSTNNSSYTGITLATNHGAALLYAANFRQNRIDVFDDAFNPVNVLPSAFKDGRIPPGYTVFNVLLVDDSLYVTYAPTNVFTTLGGRGQGYVDVYDLNGFLRHRLQHGFWMDAPWGITQAPADFGAFSHDILVGNFGSGAIAAFDAKHGFFHGFLRDPDGLPIVISKGLWGIGFGNGGNAGPTNTLYFASDILFGGRLHGLLGTLSLSPETSTGDGDDDGDDNGGPSSGHHDR